MADEDDVRTSTTKSAHAFALHRFTDNAYVRNISIFEWKYAFTLRDHVDEEEED